ncbi:MAG: hypothetical protein FD163_2514 [Hyphomonadaceae bacterium]|nr:MAG: hypothetical protein FD128_1590 [Hyphomonadaceae bacterium]KAF0182724.1 MAG: hypothetical protein FD163_2514 [Hyphomonadaceae bacterium]
MYRMQPISPEKFRSRMEEKGFSQSELARQAKVDQTLIGKILLGKVPASKHLPSFAAILNTSVEYLTDQTNDPNLGAIPTPTAESISEQLDAVSITEIDLKFGMGGGAYFDGPVEANQIVFSRSWIANFTKAAPDKLFFARGMGDSMSPTIHDGDIVLIDTSQDVPRMSDQIWAITYYSTGMIKRLRASENGYKILSDNQNVPPETASDGELSIIGRVIAIVRRV